MCVNIFNLTVDDCELTLCWGPVGNVGVVFRAGVCFQTSFINSIILITVSLTFRRNRPQPFHLTISNEILFQVQFLIFLGQTDNCRTVSHDVTPDGTKRPVKLNTIIIAI